VGERAATCLRLCCAAGSQSVLAIEEADRTLAGVLKTDA
jgi:hypothetical protein